MNPNSTEPPLYSVLCATYNQEEFIQETLQSLENQTFRNFEVVIVDDGSTDSTPRVLEEWIDRSHDFNIRIVTLVNSGQMVALEAGAAHCRGDWIALIDSDDKFSPDKLAKVAEAIAGEPLVDMWAHPLRAVSHSGHPLGFSRPRAAKISVGDLRGQMQKNARHVAPATTGLVMRRSMLETLLPSPTRTLPFAADAYLSFGFAATGIIGALNDVLGDYRMQAGSQYITRMSTETGLARQIEFQQVVARHFGLLEALPKNSQYARTLYVSRRLGRGRWKSLFDLWRLICSLVGDPQLSCFQRVLLSAFWSATLLLGRAAFLRAWRWYLARQTGFPVRALRL